MRHEWVHDSLIQFTTKNNVCNSLNSSAFGQLSDKKRVNQLFNKHEVVTPSSVSTELRFLFISLSCVLIHSFNSISFILGNVNDNKTEFVYQLSNLELI